MSNTYTLPITINGRPPQPADLGWWGSIQFDPSDAQPNYIGLNLDKDASDNATDWKIYKFTYVSDEVTKIQLDYGSWTGRVALFA
jgi:hypothetical protein